MLSENQSDTGDHGAAYKELESLRNSSKQIV